jgi:ketosteroid isomerase-like protein
MTDHSAIARAAIEAWNTHDASRVLDCYTEKLIYRDPNTSEEVHGADAFRRYLTKSGRARCSSSHSLFFLGSLRVDHQWGYPSRE